MARSPTPAERLYRVGRQAMQEGNHPRARTVLAQALLIDPRYLPAWVALYRACSGPEEQLYCLAQIGRLKPEDPRIKQAYLALQARHPGARPRPLPEFAAEGQPQPTPAAPESVAVAGPEPAPPRPLPRGERRRQRRVEALLRRAAEMRAAGDEAGALSIYLDLLYEDPAQPEALAEAVRLLSRQGRLGEAQTWVERSIEMGNQDPGAYVSLAELRLHTSGGDPWEPLAALRRLPQARPAHLVRAATLYQNWGQVREAVQVLHEAERLDPHHQPTLMRLAAIYQEYHQPARALHYLKRVVDVDPRSELGRAAEAQLLEVGPHIPRSVQTNMLYALREVLGIALFFFLLAALDAGLNVIAIDLAGWIGVSLSALGGYMVVSATSSPAQRVFQPFLGGAEAPSRPAVVDPGDGYLPPVVSEAPLPTLPEGARWALGAVGSAILLVAAGLVLRHSLVSTQQTLQFLNRGQVPDYLLDIFTLLFGY